MKRWLFNIAAGGSLLIALLVVIVWIRSESNQDAVNYLPPVTPTHQLILGIYTKPGAINFWRQIVTWNVAEKDATQQYVARVVPPFGWNYEQSATSKASTNGRISEQFRFEWEVKGAVTRSPAMTPVNIYDARLRVPDWFLLLLSGVLPTIWLIRFRRRCRLKFIGCCPKCGYDLRATPQRCPECGTAPAEHEKKISNLI